MLLSRSRQPPPCGTRPFCIIGASERDDRVVAFRRALAEFGVDRVTVVPYWKLCKEGTASLASLPEHTIVRIESPGRGFDTYKLFLEAGYAAASRELSAVIGVQTVRALVDDKGLILYPRQWYLGFQAVLSGIGNVLRSRRDILPLLPPDDIMCMFDKLLCHGLLLRNGVKVPRGIGAVRDFDELLTEMAATALTRVFIKLRHGSSASGTIAYQVSGHRHLAISTAQMAIGSNGLRLYNTRRMVRYQKVDEIRCLVNELCRHGVHVEAWFPKAGIEGMTCDCRILMIGGEPEHVVVRTGPGPMTNLHLGCKRNDSALLRARTGEVSWSSAMETCRKVARLFPRSYYMGIDLAFSPSCRSHAVLEVNAFGDLLIGIRSRGMTTHEAELHRLRPALTCQFRAVFIDLDGTLLAKPDIGTDKDPVAMRRHQFEAVGRINPDPDLISLLSDICESHTLVLVSNGSPAVQRAKLCAAGIEQFFQEVIVSGAIGCRKPRAGIFREALKRVGGSPGEVLFVGDDPYLDIEGARNAGLATCWISEGASYPPELRPPDFVLSSVHGLRGVVCL